MKNFKKLIPAFAMLLVSAILMGTSTFAWFSMNSTVIASGMQITAKTPQSLYIDTASDMANKAFRKSADSTTGGTTASLLPVSTANLTNWYTGVAATSDHYAIDSSDTYTTVTQTGNTGDYYLLNTFYIQYIGEDATTFNLGVTDISITEGAGLSGGSNKNFLDAVKVAVVIKEGSTVKGTRYYAPRLTSCSDLGVSGTTSSSTSAITWICSGSYTTLGNKLYAITANTVYTAQIYIYWDGMNAACTSDNINALNTNGLTVDISFGSIADS